MNHEYTNLWYEGYSRISARCMEGMGLMFECIEYAVERIDGDYC